MPNETIDDTVRSLERSKKTGIILSAAGTGSTAYYGHYAVKAYHQEQIGSAIKLGIVTGVMIGVAIAGACIYRKARNYLHTLRGQ